MALERVWTEKFMKVRDVTGFFETGECSPDIPAIFLTKLHRKPGGKRKQSTGGKLKRSSEEWQTSVACRGLTCLESCNLENRSSQRSMFLRMSENAQSVGEPGELYHSLQTE